MMEMIEARCGNVPSSNCQVCGGAGWVWRDELPYSPYQDDSIFDDTRYSCPYCREKRKGLLCLLESCDRIDCEGVGQQRCQGIADRYC